MGALTAQDVDFFRVNGYLLHHEQLFSADRFATLEGIFREHLQEKGDCENGCMRVIPGSHSNGFSEYSPVDQSVNTFHAEIVDVDESRAGGILRATPTSTREPTSP